ncbi:Uncharacterised protein [Providencia rettgeri]|uniref:Uncharacterized protein n=1 Tax=Providencia rettgeri TaxID=587 RepID=A0A264VS82_PRORE|nr:MULTISPECIES: hypothetical protein [Providencia]OZS74220.1 hypothetical protein CHI95_12955 [Providencia rettgeri]SPZ18301.1 Uncharacterised protein [Providencia rettgeri]
MNYCKQMWLLIILSLSFLSLFLHGCAANNSTFSPPLDGENIHFTATVPNELEALPILATYRSEVCRKERRNSIMETYTIPGFHREEYPLATNASNQVEADIPKSGGGKCNWKLSNIKFEVKLKDPSEIDPLISKNFGMEATFVLDNNAPATFDGGYEKKSGDINEQLILFPLISERFLGEHVKNFWLIGKYDVITYKIYNSKKINLTILYKKNFLTHWQGRRDQNGNTSMSYPDGTIIYNGDTKPQYNKLIEISESMIQ